MKAVIFAGGFGTRLSEETQVRPKPMVEIGGKPILWHIMKIYSNHGINDFIICLGYKGLFIKQYFNNYFLENSDLELNFSQKSIKHFNQNLEKWNVTLVDTGQSTMTGGRLKKLKKFLKNDRDFCLTYGDGVGNIDISASIDFHRRHGKLVTMTGAFPPGRFGALEIDGSRVLSYNEKPRGDGNMVNGGFFVLSPSAIDYVDSDKTTWEKEPLERLAREGELMLWKHHGFWQPMDTLADKNHLETLWLSNKAPWKVW